MPVDDNADAFDGGLSHWSMCGSENGPDDICVRILVSTEVVAGGAAPATAGKPRRLIAQIQTSPTDALTIHQRNLPVSFAVVFDEKPGPD